MVNAGGNLRYAKSTQNNELWPGVYEKAFAKWITENDTDKPDITKTAYGNPAKAAAQLIDGEFTTYLTADNSPEAIYSQRTVELQLIYWGSL